MSSFLQQAGAFLASLQVEHIVEPPFVHFPQRRLSFHLIELQPCADPLAFRQLSVEYEQQGTRLVQLWEDQWTRRQHLVQARVRALMGDSERTFARNTTITRIDRLTLDAFLQLNHLQGSPQVKYKYGLYAKDLLVAVASFSGKRPVKRDGVALDSYELVRFASMAGTTVTGGLSKLLSTFKEEIKPGDIMTYADRDWSNGHSYEQLGFTFIENTAPQTFLIHPREMQRIYLHRLPAGATEADMLRKGYFRIYNAGNKKYIYRP